MPDLMLNWLAIVVATASLWWLHVTRHNKEK